jgi:hypothetical protein
LSFSYNLCRAAIDKRKRKRKRKKEKEKEISNVQNVLFCMSEGGARKNERGSEDGEQEGRIKWRSWRRGRSKAENHTAFFRCNVGELAQHVGVFRVLVGCSRRNRRGRGGDERCTFHLGRARDSSLKKE